MQVVTSVHQLIGNTPLMELTHFQLPQGVKLYAKLEFFNPGGSVKDRVGYWMLKRAQERGTLKPGDTIVEATAGNTGIGLALAALHQGYRVILVVPGKFSVEKQMLMKALGAEIINTPTELGLQGAFDKVEELKGKLGHVFVPSQFDNPDNVEAHELFTGRELYEQLDGYIDAFVAGAGSGGTFTGVMQYLRKRGLKAKGVLADPLGSIMGGGEEGCYRIEGIGNSFIPKNFDISLVDQVIKVTDDQAYGMVADLARREGLFVGSSSGAALYAALTYGRTMEKGNLVVIFPDKADRYFSKNIFSFTNELGFNKNDSCHRV